MSFIYPRYKSQSGGFSTTPYAQSSRRDTVTEFDQTGLAIVKSDFDQNDTYDVDQIFGAEFAAALFWSEIIRLK
jgi:hypothetical protein